MHRQAKVQHWPSRKRRVHGRPQATSTTEAVARENSQLFFVVVVSAWPRAGVLQVSRSIVLARAVHTVGVTRAEVSQARRQLRGVKKHEVRHASAAGR